MFSMKRILILLILIIQANAKVLSPIELDWSIYNDVEIEELLSTLSLETDESVLGEIQVAKLSLLNGEVEGAISTLSELIEKYPKSSFIAIAKRYLAISYFIIGDYKSTYALLQDPHFSETENYKQICVLKIASNLSAKNFDDVKIDIDKCQRLNEDLSSTDFIWFEYLTTKFENQFDEVKFKEKINKLGRFEGIDYTRSWLKFSLLFNHSNFVTENLDKLPEKAFQNDILRTLLAINLYRAKNKKSAKDFIEDINNTNASYLKSLLSISDNEAKTAYAHLKTSLSRRPYSIMANQLMSALSFETKNYEDGRKALSMLIPIEKYRREKSLLLTSFLVHEENFIRANYEIEKVFYEYNKKMPFEGLMLQSYIYFKTNNQKWIATSDEACLRYDGVSCWLHAQSNVWSDYDKKLETIEATPFKVSDFIEEITQEKVHSPVQERIFIRQRDIIELDIEIDPYLEDMGENEAQS